ncbi:MAG: phosphoadenosine phosphosulfate reductase family protein [Blastocatellia bacterium]|nr:phosphoadenosine phosphosulfate reductase family protein [Blastocatellia bacterium]
MRAVGAQTFWQAYGVGGELVAEYLWKGATATLQKEYGYRDGEMLIVAEGETVTRREAWEYILKHRLPYHPLYDEGYASIGCQPCTRPVAAGAYERSGRWDGSRKQECGIHLS